MRIFMLGYMGCGKTETGRLLAKEMRLHFMDLDSVFEEKHHITIKDFFIHQGQDKFRQIERKLLENTLHNDNIVISTGGGTPCFYNNIQFIKNNGISIYLKTDINTLINRIINAKKNRPLVQNLSTPELKIFVEKQLYEREPYYLKADYIVDAENINIHHIASLITQNLAQGYPSLT